MAKTVDDVFEELRVKHEAEIQEALDWAVADGGVVDFVLGANRRPKTELDEIALQEATKPENLLARIEALEAAGVLVK